MKGYYFIRSMMIKSRPESHTVLLRNSSLYISVAKLLKDFKKHSNFYLTKYIYLIKYIVFIISNLWAISNATAFYETDPI